MAKGLHYISTIDDTDFKKKLENQRRMILDSGKTAEAEGAKIEGMFKRAGIAAAGYFTAQQALSFGQDIIRVRGERQMLEQSFEVLLQSRAKANKMISEITQLAINSPLEMTPVANAAQTLLGFGINAERVMPIISQLSDVSMGNQQRFESLALVYAQVQSAGRLMGQDLLQMINASFNPLTIIAEQTGKSVAQLKDEMSKGAISADMVAEAFRSVTAEGGKFYQMTQKQADGIIGNQATFEDAIVQMKNKIGANYEEIIKGGYKAATAVVENYEEIGDAIMVLIAAYGSYRAALIAVSVTQKLVGASGNITAWLNLAKGIRTAKDAQVALNLAMGANPILKIVSLLIAAGTALYLFSKNSNEASRSVGALEQSVIDETKEVNTLISTISNANTSEEDRRKVLVRLREIQPNIVEGINNEKIATEKLTEKLKLYNEEQVKKAAYAKLSDDVGDITQKINTAETNKALKESEAISEIDKFRNYILNGNIYKLNTKGSGKFKTPITEGIKIDINNAIQEIASSEGTVRQKIDKIIKAVAPYKNQADYNIDMSSLTDFRENLTEIDKELIGLDIDASKAQNKVDSFTGNFKAFFENKDTEGATTTIKTYSEQLSEAAANVSTLKNELSDLQSGKVQSADLAKDIEDKTKRLKEAEAKHALLSGIDKKPTSDQSKLLLDAEKDYQNARLASINDAKEAELDLERSAIDDKIKLIESERDARIKAIEEEKEAYQKEYKENADASGFDRQIAAVEQKADTDIQEQVQEDAKARLIAMQEYLKEYGSMQQKKYAVAEEYARKIKEAKTEGERLSIEKELESFNSNIETQNLKMNIDWVTVFGEFGGMFSEMIKPALKDAKKYIGTDEFKNADEASKQALIEAINQMEQSLGGSGSLNFKKLGEDVQSYQNSLIALNNAKQEEIDALNKLTEAQQNYEKALTDGSKTEVDTAETNLNNAQTNADAASKNVQTQTDTANNFKLQVNDTAANLKGGMDNITNNISKLASGSLKSAYEGIIGLMKEFSGAETVVGKLAKQMDIPIISWILGLLDVLKDGLSNLIGGLLDGVFNAVSGIISDVLSGDLFVTIGESISKGIFSIVKSIITLGGVFGFMDDESDPDLQADIDRLTASNERLEEALNRLADKMDDAKTSEATSVYKEQLDNVRNRERNSQEMMQRESAAWARFGYGFAGLGGKGSSNSKINDHISGSEWSEISKVVGRNISNAGDFWGLSSEEMAKVADEAGWIYDKIKGYADDGHKDAAQYMDDYISYAKEREELEKAYYEKLTSTSFDSVRDEFKNTLLDMESDAEDFATNFEKMMQNAIIESMMTEKYDKKLKDWYRSFGNAMEDGEMTQSEKDTLQNDYNNIVNDGIKDRDALKDIFGWDKGGEGVREATKRGIATASQESVDENNGRLTAIQGHTFLISESVKLMQPDISSIRDSMVFIRENFVTQLTILKGIERNTAPISEIKTELGYVKTSLETIRDRGVIIKK